MNSAGAEYDYSGGNLRFGTGKYQQRANDGYSGGVNLSSNGHSMQHDIYTGGRSGGGGKDLIGSRYDRGGGAYGRGGGGYDDDMFPFDEDMMMEEEMRMMEYEDMMMGGGGGGPMGGGGDYYDDLYYQRTPGAGGLSGGGGGGVFRDEYYERSGRGGPRAYSNSRNGGYTTNGRSHQFNSRVDEMKRYDDGYYYGDDAYYAERGGYGDMPPPRSSFGGGPVGLLRDMYD